MKEKGLSMMDLDDLQVRQFLSAYDGDGAQALSTWKAIVKKMLQTVDSEGNRVINQGYNALAFDIDLMASSLKKLDAWDDEAEELFKKSHILRMTDPLYMQDLIDPVKIMMRHNEDEMIRLLVGESGPFSIEEIRRTLTTIMGREPNLEEIEKVNSEITSYMRSQMVIARELMESPENLENVLSNTNFLKLIEELPDEQIQALLDELQKGAHTGTVDALMELYLGNFMTEGRVYAQSVDIPGIATQRQTGMTSEAYRVYVEKHGKFQDVLRSNRFIREDKYSEFEQLIRNIFARSSAITPTTNITDVSSLSDQLFDFISTKEQGIQRQTVGVLSSDLDRLGLTTTDNLRGSHSDGGIIGSIDYNESENKFRFKSDRTGNYYDIPDVNQVEAEKIIKESLQKARTGTRSDLSVKTASGKTFTIRNQNIHDMAIRSVGLTPFDQTQFDQMIDNAALSARMPSIKPTTIDELAKSSTVTNVFYGQKIDSISKRVIGDIDSGGIQLGKIYGMEELTPEQIENVTKAGMEVEPGVTSRGLLYGQNVVQKGLAFSDIDYRNRVMGVARAKATSNIAAQSLEISKGQEGVLGNIGRSLSSIDNPVQRSKVISALADYSPLSFAIGQGKETLYKNIYSTNDISRFESGAYARIPSFGGETKGSQKIIMNLEDMADLKIHIGGGRTVEFGGESFTKISSLNRFYESVVKDQSLRNMVFAPSFDDPNLYKELADQIIAKQFTRYKTSVAEPGAKLAKPMVEEFSAVLGKIFGDSESIDKVMAQNAFTESFKDLGVDSFEKRVQLIEENFGAETAKKYRQYIEGILNTDSENPLNIVGFKFEGTAANDIAMAEAATTPGVGAVETPNTTYRLQSIGMTDDAKPAYGVFTPGINEAMDSARRQQTGKISSDSIGIINNLDDPSLPIDPGLPVRYGDELGLQRAAEATEALGNLEQGARIASGAPDDFLSAVGQASQMNVEGRTVNTGQTAFTAGRNFMKKNKTGIYLAGLAVAAAGIGGMVAKKRNESQQYSTTMNAMPVERGKRPYGIQESMFSLKQGSSRRSPLSTAGVVGNLDRNKINHTSMGTDKNSHLFDF